jgi:hypothetical protein
MVDAFYGDLSGARMAEERRGRALPYSSAEFIRYGQDYTSMVADPRPWPARPVFFVIREHGFMASSPLPSPSPSPSPVGFAEDIVERTASGISIARDTDQKWSSTQLLEDDEAFWRVKTHMSNFRRRFPNSTHERILRSLIYPKSTDAEYPIDNTALESIFFAANAMFFHGRLTQRVSWDWSHDTSTQYCTKIVGTTALRRSARRGLETLIVLSSPILRDTQYNRRLLISTFLHELIHSYLFICCGFRAREGGGHTPGFHAIAELIDSWAGYGVLHLSDIEADLDRFRIRRRDAQHRKPHEQIQQNDYVYLADSEAQHSCSHDLRQDDSERSWRARSQSPRNFTSRNMAPYTFGAPAQPARPSSASRSSPALRARVTERWRLRDDGRYSPY